jgi:hypothetical protein
VARRRLCFGEISSRSTQDPDETNSGLTPISPPVVKGKDVPRSVVGVSHDATVRSSLRITAVPFRCRLRFQRRFPPGYRKDSQHLLRLTLREAKCEGRQTHAASKLIRALVPASS